ncbi:Shedu anti-phage system protein SduA domain-containing protein [Vibrio harveyi]|uniref:Shedu anti-phage system protein SduA domain-containing protein n=1 Tax=Vibrio harveyi TaxID=669 RepID=UPI002380727F|nr:Shedu anti-phage system protein SduA domain-containing protein [Vibrio harveyi]
MMLSVVVSVAWSLWRGILLEGILGKQKKKFSGEFASIDNACREVFGKKIDVSNRARIALLTSIQGSKILGSEIAHYSSLDCFRSALTHSPAASDIFLQNEGSLDHLLQVKKIQSQVLVRPRLGDYINLIRDIFISKFPFHASQLHGAGKKVIQSGQLTEVDLVLACLQSAQTSLYPTSASKIILDRAGIRHGYTLNGDNYSSIECDEHLYSLEQSIYSSSYVDSCHGEQQLIMSLDESRKIKLQLFGANTVGRIEDNTSKFGGFTFRGGVLQPSSSHSMFSTDSILELEDMMNSESTLEREYQDFFERYPEYINALDYTKAHAQPILYQDDGSKLIPDFFLEQADNGWHAIAELKKSTDSMVVRQKNRVRFSHWVSDAIAQLQFYREWFDSKCNREEFGNRQGISTQVYRPKMVLIAGRRHHFLNDIERIRLITNQNRDLSIWTYDDVLSRAKKYQKFAINSLR